MLQYTYAQAVNFLVTYLVLDSTIACVVKGVISTLTISTSSNSLTTSSFVVTLVLFDDAVVFVLSDNLPPDSDFVSFLTDSSAC